MSWRRVSPFTGDKIEFLGNPHAPHFEHITIHLSELVVGDHLIVHNHPAYSYTNLDGVFTLENALVVQTIGIKPGGYEQNLLLHGHGIHPKTMGELKKEMHDTFTRELKKFRKMVETHIKNAGNSEPVPEINIGLKKSNWYVVFQLPILNLNLHVKKLIGG